jgi:ElaB/YqjD/DUF883 family membrane-anchored ribosome-binding protein
METSMSARNVEHEFDALKSDFGKMSADLVSLTQALRDLAAKDGEAYLSKARNVVGQANEDVEAAAAALAARGREGLHSVAVQVRERPLTSILVCLGVGVVIGKLFDR